MGEGPLARGFEGDATDTAARGLTGAWRRSPFPSTAVSLSSLPVVCRNVGGNKRGCVCACVCVCVLLSRACLHGRVCGFCVSVVPGGRARARHGHLYVCADVVGGVNEVGGVVSVVAGRCTVLRHRPIGIQWSAVVER